MLRITEKNLRAYRVSVTDIAQVCYGQYQSFNEDLFFIFYKEISALNNNKLNPRKAFLDYYKDVPVAKRKKLRDAINLHCFHQEG